MSATNRILVSVVIILVIVGLVLGVDFLRRRQQALEVPELTPGAIPIYKGDQLLAGFVPDDLEQLAPVSFVDDEEGKSQDGWLLHDVLLLYIEPASLNPEAIIKISSREGDT